LNRFKSRVPDVTARKVGSQRYCQIPIGESGVHLEWSVRGRFSDRRLLVCLDLEGSKETNERIFQYLKKHETDLKKDLGFNLQFQYPRGTKWARIFQSKPFNAENQQEVEEVKQWGVEKMVDFHKAFKPLLLTALDPNNMS